ncbi:uncharacterized protein BKCO1_4700084 [Diplodia corticola]|uniref:Uncharacterized protein n=1 Tax=Diplodia corticola TaxID=236234 RepID=A0A1J9RUF4_9PEZI|nr:uncharacterized protein BKCO1_4700084 [Diplodia corticola]OJD31484.1 hypothetical protein BKCO1_4700084 [Diplodia corticola]
MAETQPAEQGHHMCPIFCTANVPTSLLEELIADPTGVQDFRLIDIETGPATSPFPSRAPLPPTTTAAAAAFHTAFFNWPPDLLYTYWKTHLRAPPDGSTRPAFSAFTFVVVDQEAVDAYVRRAAAQASNTTTTTSDDDDDVVTVLLCTDAPDFDEDEDEAAESAPVLKTLRWEVADVAAVLPALESLTMCPSELDSPVRLSVMPPPAAAAAAAGGPAAMRRARVEGIRGAGAGLRGRGGWKGAAG